jgi:hypothetical protein
MRTLPILVDAAPAALPSPGAASLATGANSTGFFQLLQQWDSDVHSVARSGVSSSSCPAADSGSKACQESLVEGDARFVNGATASIASNVKPDVPAISGSAEKKLAKNIGSGVVLNSANDAKQGGAKKTAAKQASSQTPVHSTASSSIATPCTSAIPLPTPKQAGLFHSPSGTASLASTQQESSGAQPASVSIDPLVIGPVLEAAEQAPGLVVATAMASEAIAGPSIGTATAYLSFLSKQSPSQAAQDAAIPKAVGDTSTAAQLQDSTSAEGALAAAPSNSPELAAQAATEAVTTTAASSAAWLATSSAASPAASPATSLTAQPKAKPQAAVSPAKPGGVAASASSAGDDPQFVFKNAQPVTGVHSLPARNNFVQAGSPVNHSLLRNAADASSHESKSSSRDEGASHGVASSAARQTSSTANAPGNQDSSAGTGASFAHALHAQASSLPSADSQSSGLQNSGGQAAAAPPPAATSSAPTVVPAPPQGSTLFSAPQQLQPSAGAAPSHMVDSGQFQTRGNNSELKISVQLPELGKVEVRAVTSRDVTTAHLTTNHPDALQVLAADRTTLEQALKSRDVILGTLDSHAQNSHGQSGGEQRQQSSQSSAQPSGGTPSTDTIATASALADTAAGLLPDYSSISVRA